MSSTPHPNIRPVPFRSVPSPGGELGRVFFLTAWEFDCETENDDEDDEDDIHTRALTLGVPERIEPDLPIRGETQRTNPETEASVGELFRVGFGFPTLW